jgi:hypothetical protein
MQLIPEDIISYIIDCLDVEEGDTRDLCACNFVSRVFRVPSQKRIFSTISIHLDPETWCESRSKRLLELFEGSPDAASYVKTLNLGVTRLGPCPHSLYLLGKLHRIRNLSLHNGISPPDKLTVSLNQGINSLLRLPSLEYFEVGGFPGYISSALNECGPLRRLSLEIYHFAEEGLQEEKNKVVFPTANLESFQLAGPFLSHIFLNGLLLHSSTSTLVLTELILQIGRMSKGDISHLQRVIDICSQTLGQLTLSGPSLGGQ